MRPVVAVRGRGRHWAAQACAHAPELWQQYQEEREKRRKIAPRSHAPLYPMTNLAKCDHCRGTAPVESKERHGSTIQNDRARAAKEAGPFADHTRQARRRPNPTARRLRSEPEDYAEGEYESARARIKEQQATTTALLEKVRWSKPLQTARTLS